MIPNTLLLCRVEEVPDGASRGFDPWREGRDTVFVVRQGEALFGYRDACPHVDGAPMAWRKDAYLNGDSSHIVCHGHGALFDIATGVCVRGPCLGEALTPVAVTRGLQDEVRLAGPHPHPNPFPQTGEGEGTEGIEHLETKT